MPYIYILRANHGALPMKLCAHEIFQIECSGLTDFVFNAMLFIECFVLSLQFDCLKHSQQQMLSYILNNRMHCVPPWLIWFGRKYQQHIS